MRVAMRQLGLAAFLWCAAAAAQDRTLQLAPHNAAPPGERRVALVIGNSAYKASPLRNPVNDARAMSKALAATGFKVSILEDAGEAAMQRAIRDFGDELRAGGVGLFYYAGHGMQVRGRNYLIPVDADIQREDEVEFLGVDANLVLSKMDTAKNALNVVILDACRNNPFARAFRSAGQGLAQMDAPSGTLVAFATAPGSVAADGEGDNGLYTKHLLANIGRRGLPIEQLFKEVRIGVGRETGDRQIPWESSSLRGDFYFIAPDPSVGPEAQRQQLEKAVADAVRREQEKLAEQQRRMEAMIREMLAKQRVELEADIRRREEALGRKPAAPPVMAAPAPAPVEIQPTQVAAAAPLNTAAAIDPRLPKVGDEWQYAYVDRLTREKRTYFVEAVGVSADGILDEDNLNGSQAHGPGAEVFMKYGAWVFSPYLHLFDGTRPGARWDDIRVRNDASCARTPSCRYDAEVVGVERVSTQAGVFDALRVDVDFTSSSAGFYTRRRGSFWYAEAAKRLVKSTVRTVSGNTNAPDYDLELVSYKLK